MPVVLVVVPANPSDVSAYVVVLCSAPPSDVATGAWPDNAHVPSLVMDDQSC
jgi:hypothetical protein